MQGTTAVGDAICLVAMAGLSGWIGIVGNSAKPWLAQDAAVVKDEIFGCAYPPEHRKDIDFSHGEEGQGDKDDGQYGGAGADFVGHSFIIMPLACLAPGY